jgi:hypothetical protein
MGSKHSVSTKNLSKQEIKMLSKKAASDVSFIVQNNEDFKTALSIESAMKRRP